MCVCVCVCVCVCMCVLFDNACQCVRTTEVFGGQASLVGMQGTLAHKQLPSTELHFVAS